MSLQIAVVTDLQGLNHNLIELALLPTGGRIKFLNPEQISSKTLENTGWLVVDDRCMPNPKKLLKLLGPKGVEKSLIYLTGHKNPPIDRQQFPRWNFLAKPFNPRELRSMMT